MKIRPVIRETVFLPVILIGALLLLFRPWVSLWLVFSSAHLAGFYRGLKPVYTSEGWLLIHSNLEVLINDSCSGFVFFTTLCCLLLWLVQTEKPATLNRGLLSGFILLSTLLITPFINSARILIATALHRFTVSAGFEYWQTQIHVLGGILTFLPAMIFIFFITKRGLEYGK